MSPIDPATPSILLCALDRHLLLTETDGGVMQTRSFTVYVAASSGQVWRALTDPELTRQFYFGLAVCSDWTPGATITFSAGEPASTLVGQVVHVDQGRRLVHSFGSGSGGDPAEDAQSWVSWELTDVEPGVARVSLTHDDLEHGPDAELDESWLRLLCSLKTLLETGAALHPGPAEG